MVVAVVSVPLLLHGMGPSAFGTWVLIQTFSAVTGWFSLADIGVGAATTFLVGKRLGSNDGGGVHRTIGTALVVFLALGAGFGAIFALVGPHLLPLVFRFPSELSSVITIVLVLFGVQIFIDTVTEGLESCLEGLQRVDLSRAVDAIRRTFVAVATAIAALAGGGLEGVAAASMVASLVGVGSGMAFLRTRLQRGWRGFDRAEVRPLFSYGARVAALDANGVLHRTMDRTLVGIFVGPAAVSLVEIATQIMNGAAAVLSAASYAVVSGAALLHGRRDPKALRSLLERGTKLTLVATWPIVAGTALLAGPLVRIWVGPEYSEAAGLAVVSLLYIGLSAPIQVGSNLLRGVGRVSAVLLPAAVAVVVNLLASLLLVNTVGTVGTLLGSLVGLIILLPAITRSFLEVTDVPSAEFLRRSVLPVVPPTAALALTLGIVLALGLADLTTVILGALAGGAIYLLVALVTAVRPAELRELLPWGAATLGRPGE